jgi:hypothetical protein
MRRLAALVTVACGLTLVATASAKGPSAATIDGPGIGGGMTFGGHDEPSGRALSTFAQQGGFYAASFAQTPDPMLDKRPAGNLGPRYAVTFRVPGPNGTDLVRQDLYPYATNGPVTFTQPKQRFFGTRLTPGGWYQATPQLKELLVARGLPENPPAARGNGASAEFKGLWTALGIAFVVGLGALATLLIRRRPRTAAT